MSRLPVVSGRDVVKLLTRMRFEIVGRKGSHVRLKRKRDKEVLIVVVPMHRELRQGNS